MSRGYPDYFGTSIFPKYGAFSKKDVTVLNNDFNDDHTILTISAKGVTYGGSIFLYGVVLTGIVRVGLIVDGEPVFFFTPSQEITRPVTNPHSTPLFLVLYDKVKEYYTIGIRQGITFEQTLVVTARGAAEGTVDCWAHVYYGRVV